MSMQRSKKEGLKRSLSWLLVWSMTLSLFSGVVSLPVRAAGEWSVTYDSAAFSGEQLTVELYDADSAIGEGIAWTDGSGFRTADRTAEELFGDGHAYYAVVQYLDADSAQAEYRNYLAGAMGLAAQWQEMLDYEKVVYGSYEAYVQAQTAETMQYMTPQSMQTALDNLANYGQYIPAGDYRVKMLARTVALAGEDPDLHIAEDFFADCAPVEWTLPEGNSTSGGLGGDYSDWLGGSSGVVGGQMPDYGSMSTGSLRLLLKDGNTYIPALIDTTLLSVEGDEESSAGEAYLAQRLGYGGMEADSGILTGKIDTGLPLYIAPGDYAMVYSDSTLLDWEFFEQNDLGATVDFATGRSFGTLSAAWSGFLEEATTGSLQISFTGDTVPGTLELSVGDAPVNCRSGHYQVVTATAMETWIDMTGIDLETGNMDDLSMSMATISLELEEELDLTGAQVLSLGDLAANDWQGRLDIVSADTGKAKANYAPGEQLEATMTLTRDSGARLLTAYAMSGSFIQYEDFMAAPTDAKFNQLFTVPQVTLTWSGSQDILAQGLGNAAKPLTFTAPDATRVASAAFSLHSFDETINMSAAATAPVPVGGAVDTQPPAVPTGFAGSMADTITFNWNANQESDLAGYLLYRADEQGNLLGDALRQPGVNATSATLTVNSQWGRGPWYFVLQAVDAAGNLSECTAPVTIQDPNADFYGTGTAQVTLGSLANGVLALTDDNAGQLTLTFTADETLPEAGLPAAMGASIDLRDVEGKLATQQVTLDRLGHTYAAIWDVPERAAILGKVTFAKDGSAVGSAALSCEIEAPVSVTIPAEEEYPLAGYLTALRLTGGGKTADLTGENGTFTGRFLRRYLPSASAYFSLEAFPYQRLYLSDRLPGSGGATQLTAAQMPNAALVIPSWEPADAQVTAKAQLLDGEGTTLDYDTTNENGGAILLTNMGDIASVRLSMSAHSGSDLQITGTDPIFNGVPWEKGGIYTAKGTMALKDAQNLLELDLFWGENGNEPYTKSVQLTLRGESRSWRTIWYPELGQADVSHIPNGTYDLSCNGSQTVQVTLNGAAVTNAASLVSYDKIRLNIELSLPLSANQPDGVEEELQSSGSLQQNWVALDPDTIRLYYYDKDGIRQNIPCRLNTIGTTGTNYVYTEAIECRQIDLTKPLELETGDSVRLYIFDSVLGDDLYYRPHRTAAIAPMTVTTEDFSKTEQLFENIGQEPELTFTGSQSVRLKAVPVIQVTATRQIKTINAYFLFANEQGSRLEIRTLEASRSGGVQRFTFEEVPQGTYDVLFYLSDQGRDEQLEQRFRNSSGTFVPPAKAMAVGLRGVTFDDQNNLCSLDTPAQPVDEAVPGIQGVTVTPSQPTVLEGDLLSFTMKFTCIPGAQPVTLRLVPTNFEAGSEAVSVSLKAADGSAVPCAVNGDQVTIPNDRGPLTGTIVYAGTADVPNLNVINASNSASIDVQTVSGGEPGYDNWSWYNSVRIIVFTSNLPGTVQGDQVPVKGRAPTGAITADIVSLKDSTSAVTIPINTSEYGYWSETLTFPYTVEEGSEDFRVTFKRDGQALETQQVTATRRPRVLPSLIRYKFHYDDDEIVTLVGRREDNYKALQDAVINFYIGYGDHTVTVEAVFDDQTKNESGYTDAQIVANPCLLVYGATNLYYFDLVPTDQRSYQTPQGRVPYATTYSATYRDIYHGPFEVCYDILDPNGVTVPQADTRQLPRDESELAQLKTEWGLLAQAIYRAGGNWTGESTVVGTVQDAALEEALTGDEFAKEGITAQQREQLADIVMFPEEPTDIDYEITHRTSLTTVADIEETMAELDKLEALDGLEDAEDDWLYYSREEGDDGVVAYVRHFAPVYAYALSEDQPEDESMVNLDLVMVQSYVYLYDLSQITEPAEAALLAARSDRPMLAAAGDGQPAASGQIFHIAGAENLKTYGTAIAKGTALGLMEAGDVISKGVDMVTVTAESLALFDLEPESLAAVKNLDDKMFGKDAKVIKGIGIVKSAYEAGKTIVESTPENNARRDMLSKIKGELEAQKNASIARCTCLLDENGENAQREIYKLYREGLDRIDDLIDGIDLHENTDIVVDLGQGVAPMPKDYDFNLYKRVADFTIDSTQEIAWSMHDSKRWQDVRDVYQEVYNGMSLASFKCDPTKCETQEPKVVDNLARAESRYTGPIPASPVGRISPKFIIDPSGVVYEGLLDNALEGVICTIQYLDGAQWKDWAQAPGYNDQLTVITTDASGYYRWDVPRGTWRVKYYKAGYNGDLPVYSDEMPVPPVWLDVNQNMLANDSTPTAAVSSENGTVLVAFDTPVSWDTVAAGISVAAAGTPVAGSWSILQGGVGDIYADGVTFSADGRPAETPAPGQLVTQIRFTPDETPTAGAGFAVAFTAAVESYGGDAMAPVTLPVTISGGTSGGSAGGFRPVGPSPEKDDDAHDDKVTASPDGGRYTAFDGDVTLEVGKNSFTAKTDIALQRSEGTAYSDTYTILFDVQPKDTVEITIPLNNIPVPDVRKLGLWVQKDGADSWTFAGGAYDPETNTLTLLTRMDGAYQVRYTQQSFTDLSPAHWAYDFLDILAARAIMQGNDLGQAQPDRTITRAETAALLVRVLQANSLLDRVPVVEDNFTDVRAGDWYYYPINLAAKRGLITGYGDGRVGPNDRVTREQLATMLARAIASDAELAAAGAPVFNDAHLISDWARPYVAVLQTKGIMQGDEKGNFDPKKQATRAETAALLYRTMELFGLLYLDENAPELPCLTCPYSR